MGGEIITSGNEFREFASKCADEHIPFVTFFELTAACNARCPFCLRPPTDRQYSKERLSLQEIKQIIDQVWEMGCFFIEFTGGEPLLHPGFDNVVGYARHLGFAVAITTNGFLLNDARIEYLSELGLFNIMVSLHSVRDDTYSKMFGVKRSAKPVLESLRKLKAKGASVSVAFTATRINIDEFSETKNVLMDLGFAPNEIGLTVVHERADGDPLDRLMPTDAQIRNLYLQNPEYRKTRTDQGRSSLVCVAGRSLLSIDFWGNVHPCTLFELPAGNVRNQSIRDIWTNSPVFQRIRSICDSDFSTCLQCSAFQYCEVCIARNHSCFNDFFRLSPINCREAYIVLQAANLARNSLEVREHETKMV